MMANKYLPVFESNQYFYESKRLETFKEWPFGARSQCNPQKMAEAGWFAVEGLDVYDVAKCMICEKELDGWENTDDPWKEHSKHCPKCPFVVVHKKQADWKYSDYLSFAREVYVGKVLKDTNDKLARMDELFEAYERKKLGPHNNKF